MEASLRVKAEELAEEFADQHTTPEDLNAFIRLMMKTAVERMLNTEPDMHLVRRGVPAAVESVKSVIRKFTRNRKLDPSAESAIKGVYLAIREAAKKWTMPIRQWKPALNYFAIAYEGRMPTALSK